MPGWEILWYNSNTVLLIFSGSRGQRIPVDMSQRRLEPEQGTEITDKVDEQRRTSTFGQDCCRRDILEKDTPGTGGGGVGWSSEISVVVFVDKGCWGCCGTLLISGQDRASATTFSGPGRWRISLLNSDRNDNLLCCMVDQGGDVLNKANVRGLWSINNINNILLVVRLLQHGIQRHLRTKISGRKESVWTRVGTFSRMDLDAAKDWFISRSELWIEDAGVRLHLG